MPKSTLLRLGAVAVLAAGLLACEKETQQAAPTARPPAQVGFIVAAAERVDLTARLPGRTVAFRMAEVRPQVEGIVVKRLFEEGSRVEAGQPLYQIDPASYRAKVRMAEAELQRAKATLEATQTKVRRLSALVRTSAVSQQAFDDVIALEAQHKADVAAEEAALEAARIDLGYTTVRAPIAGRIGRSTITEGALVTANQAAALATITQLDPILVDFTQSSGELLRLQQMFKTGKRTRGTDETLPVRLVLDATDRAYPLEGRLQFSEVTVNETTATIRLRAVFPNPEQELLPGLFVHGLVNQGVVESGILVPQAAVSFTPAGEPYVFTIAEGNVVKLTRVHLVDAVGDKWLVDEGVQPGVRVVVDGLQRIRDGAPVTPVPAGGGAPAGGQPGMAKKPAGNAG